MPPLTWLNTDAGIIRLPRYIVGWEALRDEVVARAALHQAHPGWLRSTYRRPAAPSG